MPAAANERGPICYVVEPLPECVSCTRVYHVPMCGMVISKFFMLAEIDLRVSSARLELEPWTTYMRFSATKVYQKSVQKGLGED